MASFLDKTGTTYLWGKITERIAQSTANKALSISLTSSITTWAEIYNQISTIPSGATANLYSHESLSTIITNGKLTNTVFVGTITRAGANYTFTVSSVDGSTIYTFRLTNCSASSRTVGDVRQFTGTVI